MEISDRLLALFVRLPVLLVLLAGVSAASPARADMSQCTVITSTPYRITQSGGRYCLASNLTHNGSGNVAAITVTAFHTTLDCNGYSITNTNLADQGSGLSMVNMHDLRVHNCTFNDFYRGVVMSNGWRSRLENTTVARSRSIGINVSGRDAIVVRNRVIDSVCQGMVLTPAGGSVVVANDNIIRGVTCPTNVAVGMALAGTGRSLVANNRFEGLGNVGTTTQAYGVLVSTHASVSVPALLDDNHMYLMKSGKNMAVAKAGTTQKSRCRNTVTPGTWLASSGCL